MPFVKLDCGILDSTTWIDRPAREIFITALLMAEPGEAMTPCPQYHVRTGEPTGWAAPAGWYGFVWAAGSGIIRRAGIDAEEGLAALERLGAPEPDSRSQEHEGRRLIRIDGGYVVLNFFKYRDRDYTTAKRSARYRERLKSRRDVTVSHRDITQAEADAEADAYQDRGERVALAPPPPQESSGKGNGKAKKRGTTSHFVPEEFEVNEALRVWAQAEYPNVDLYKATQKFRTHEFKTPRSDWVKAWKNWIIGDHSGG